MAGSDRVLASIMATVTLVSGSKSVTPSLVQCVAAILSLPSAARKVNSVQLHVPRRHVVCSLHTGAGSEQVEESQREFKLGLVSA
jgi:hypothetical protein